MYLLRGKGEIYIIDFRYISRYWILLLVSSIHRYSYPLLFLNDSPLLKVYGLTVSGCGVACIARKINNTNLLLNVQSIAKHLHHCKDSP